MRSIGRLAGAGPWSYCGRASGCVLPRRTVSLLSSTGAVINERAELDCPELRCEISETEITARNTAQMAIGFSRIGYTPDPANWTHRTQAEVAAAC